MELSNLFQAYIKKNEKTDNKKLPDIQNRQNTPKADSLFSSEPAAGGDDGLSVSLGNNNNGYSVLNSSAKKTNGLTPEQIAGTLIRDIYADDDGFLELPTTGKYIKNHIRQINKDNVSEVLISYKEKTGKDEESLISAIFSEKGLSPEERAEMVRHTENALLEQYESKGVYVNDVRKMLKKEIFYQEDRIGPMNAELIDKLNDKLEDRLMGKKYLSRETKPADGKVNEVIYQGNTGDCWLLAPVNSIAKSPKGQEILNKSLKVNPDGSVTVSLQGVKKSYTFSKAELEGSTELSTGDMDVRALEKAVERYMMENKHNDINGNRAINAYKILLGKSRVDLGGWDEIWDMHVGISDSYRKKIQDPNTICNAAIHDNDDYLGGGTTNDGVELHANHMYSVVRADNKYVYLINPWDSGKEIRMTFEEFKKTFNSFADVTL